MKPVLTTKNPQGLRVIHEGAKIYLSKPNSHLFSTCVGVIIECGFQKEPNNSQNSGWSQESKWIHTHNEDYKLEVKVVDLDHTLITASHRGLLEMITLQVFTNDEHILGKLRTQEIEGFLVFLRDHYKRSLLAKTYTR